MSKHAVAGPKITPFPDATSSLSGNASDAFSTVSLKNDVVPLPREHSIVLLENLTPHDRDEFIRRVKHSDGALHLVVHPYDNGLQYRSVAEPPSLKTRVDSATSRIFLDSATGVPAIALIEYDRVAEFIRVAGPLSDKTLPIVTTEFLNPTPTGRGSADLHRWKPLKQFIIEARATRILYSGSYLAVGASGYFEGCVGATINALKDIADIEITNNCRPHGRRTLVNRGLPYRYSSGSDKVR